MYVAGAILLAATPAARAQDQLGSKDPVVSYRADIMAAMGKQAAALGAIMQKTVPYEANIALHAEAISVGAKEALAAFEKRQPGGTAKPEIWDNWKDFSDRLNALAASADALAKKAAAGPVTDKEVLGMLSCKSCHDVYRSKG